MLLHDFFSQYEDLFSIPELNSKVKNLWLAFPFLISNKKFDRNSLQIFLEKNNIQTRTIFSGNILKQPGYKKYKYKKIKSGYPNSDYVMKNGILIGCHQSMTIKEIKYIFKKIKEFINKY